MPDLFQDFFRQIPHGQPEAGGVDAGMAAEVFLRKNLLIHQKLHPSLVIVHQSHYADRTRT